jgi:hypothetical protein
LVPAQLLVDETQVETGVGVYSVQSKDLLKHLRRLFVLLRVEQLDALTKGPAVGQGVSFLVRFRCPDLREDGGNHHRQKNQQ